MIIIWYKVVLLIISHYIKHYAMMEKWLIFPNFWGDGVGRANLFVRRGRNVKGANFLGELEAGERHGQKPVWLGCRIRL